MGTAHLLWPYLLASQAQKHISHNEALRLLDGRGGSVCLNSVRGVHKWLRRPVQAAAGIGVARSVYA